MVDWPAREKPKQEANIMTPVHVSDKKVAILQSNYIPWKGYFDLIGTVDEVILFDDMQYTRRDWRNRNKIKIPNGTQWLTIPVNVKGKYHQVIKDVQTSGNEWRKKHWTSLCHNYSKAPHFQDYAPIFEELYLRSDENSNVQRSAARWSIAANF